MRNALAGLMLILLLLSAACNKDNSIAVPGEELVISSLKQPGSNATEYCIADESNWLQGDSMTIAMRDPEDTVYNHDSWCSGYYSLSGYKKITLYCSVAAKWRDSTPSMYPAMLVWKLKSKSTKQATIRTFQLKNGSSVSVAATLNGYEITNPPPYLFSLSFLVLMHEPADFVKVKNFRITGQK